MGIFEQNRIRAEKQALNVSLYGGIFFVFAECLMALSTSSQSILMDAVYDAADLLMIVISIKIIPLLYRPTTEKHPFGFSQVEAIFITIKGSMLIAVTVGLVMNNIQIILSGGNHVNFNRVVLFELFAAGICGVILFLLVRLNRKIDSPIVRAEIQAWIIDSIASLGLSAAFILPAIIHTDWIRNFTPYLDQVVAIALSAFILPLPIKTVLSGLRDLFLLAPDDDSVSLIKEIGQRVLGQYHMEQTAYDVIKTGRKIWISIYFKSPNDTISVSLIMKAHKELEAELKQEFPDLYVELVPEIELVDGNCCAI